tara:strand:+ start:497 stop:772 length:276 start_codon:yes stop_codon:yes gene_type:complete
MMIANYDFDWSHKVMAETWNHPCIHCEYTSKEIEAKEDVVVEFAATFTNKYGVIFQFRILEENEKELWTGLYLCKHCDKSWSIFWGEQSCD